MGGSVSPWGVPPFDCVRKRFGGFNRFRGFNGGGAAPDPSTQFSLFRLYMISLASLKLLMLLSKALPVEWIYSERTVQPSFLYSKEKA